MTTFFVAILASTLSIGLFSAVINCDTMPATSIDAVLEVLDEVIATGRPLLLKPLVSDL